jgi:hypothetical protein
LPARPALPYGLPSAGYVVPLHSALRSPFTSHRSPFTVHRSPFTVHQSPVTSHQSVFVAAPCRSSGHRTPPIVGSDSTAREAGRRCASRSSTGRAPHDTAKRKAHAGKLAMSWLLPWQRRPRLPNRGAAVWWNATSGRVSGRTGVFRGGVAGSLARRSVCGAPAPPRVLRCTDRKTHRSGSPPCLHMRCEAFPAGHRKQHASRVLHPGGTAATDGDGTSQPRSQPLCAAKFASSPCRRA